MKNIWIDLARESNHRKTVNRWLRTVIVGGLRGQARKENLRLAKAMYAMAEVVFNRFKVLLAKDRHYDEADVMQECVLAQIKRLDGAEMNEDPFGYFYRIVKTCLQSLHDTKIQTSSKDYNLILNKFKEKIKEI